MPGAERSRRERLARRGAVPLVALAAGALVAACGGSAAQSSGGGGTCEEARRLADLPREVQEASGMARDPRRDGLFWVHNDSENDPVLYGVDLAGRLLAAYRISGGTDLDPEALALARCGAEWCLYLGDIGDNLGLRREVLVHRLPLPPLPAAPQEGGSGTPARGVLRVEASLRLRYPDSPRDAEGLAVDAERKELVVISKGREGTAYLYAAPLAQDGEGPATLRRVGALKVPFGATTADLLTDAGLSPDGRYLAVRSYANLFLFPWRGTGGFDAEETPLTASLLAAVEPQGEGLAFGARAGEIYLVSESRAGKPPQLSVVRCPDLAPE